jgi:hypothetical protein
VEHSRSTLEYFKNLCRERIQHTGSGFWMPVLVHPRRFAGRLQGWKVRKTWFEYEKRSAVNADVHP